MKEKEIDLWDELSIEQQQSIRRSQKEFTQGKVVSHEVVMKQYSKYLINDQ